MQVGVIDTSASMLYDYAASHLLALEQHPLPLHCAGHVYITDKMSLSLLFRKS